MFVDNHLSYPVPLTCGISQCSALGPILLSYSTIITIQYSISDVKNMDD